MVSRQEHVRERRAVAGALVEAGPCLPAKAAACLGMGLFQGTDILAWLQVGLYEEDPTI